MRRGGGFGSGGVLLLGVAICAGGEGLVVGGVDSSACWCWGSCGFDG